MGRKGKLNWIEQELEDVIRDSENRKEQYKQKFKRLAKKAARMQKKGQRGSNKSKRFTDYTKQHQARLRRGFKEDCHSALSFLGLYNFIATKVEVFNNDTQQYETISLVEEGELQLLETEPRELTDNDIDDINMWVYLKDKLNICNEAWHELAMKCKDMPTNTILNEKDAAMNEKGNYVLTIIKTTENYDNLKESLADLNNEMSNLKEITVNSHKYSIEYFLGGDWKFLACVCGLGATNQNFSCIWCKCPRNERFDISKKWSITDKSLGARDLQEIGKYANLSNIIVKPIHYLILFLLTM